VAVPVSDDQELRTVPGSEAVSAVTAASGASLDDIASFDGFVREHQAALVRYAALLAGSVAQGEDLVQEVLVRLYSRWGQLDDPLPYVRRSVTNEHLSWRRRWSTRHIHAVEQHLLDQQTVDPWADGADPELWARLRRLPGQQRAAVVLRYYEGLSDAEIGAVLSCREGTVRAHVSRGLAGLRTALAEPETAGAHGPAGVHGPGNRPRRLPEVTGDD
jgi:RNA polymerase sigma-70 factor (sigma-E family)